MFAQPSFPTNTPNIGGLFQVPITSQTPDKAGDSNVDKPVGNQAPESPRPSSAPQSLLE